MHCLIKTDHQANETFVQPSFLMPTFETIYNADDLYPEFIRCQISILRKPCAKLAP